MSLEPPFEWYINDLVDILSDFKPKEQEIMRFRFGIEYYVPCRDDFTNYYFTPHLIYQTLEKYNISIERCLNIEKKVFEKLYNQKKNYTKLYAYLEPSFEQSLDRLLSVLNEFTENERKIIRFRYGYDDYYFDTFRFKPRPIYEVVRKLKITKHYYNMLESRVLKKIKDTDIVKILALYLENRSE